MDDGNSDDRTQSVTTWLEANLGGRVVAIERQARWRPVWFADLERDGESLALCVRGERADTDIGFSLRSEMQFQTLLEEGGIPVAHVYGWIDDPRAYVMDRVAGRADFEGATEDERDAVMRDYMEILARVHALDVGPFADAGLLRAASAVESGTVGIQCYERAYRKVKKRPDPFLEFCLGWLARNPLDNAGRETPVVWDSGQFHHRNGRVEALLDLELGHLGDPMMDLAGFRQRDTVLGFGEFPRLYDHYAEAGGQPIDLRAIQHHHLCFTLTNELAFHAALADPPSDSDFMTNMQWASETNLFAVEALAEILGVTLREVEVPEPCSSSAAVAHSHLVQSLRFHEAGNDFAQHQVRIAFRLARHLQRSDEIGDAVVASNLDDLGALLGRRPANWEEGDAALERFVFEDGGRHDAELTQLFHRRLQRYRMLLGPPGSAMVRHNEIQGFGQARLHND